MIDQDGNITIITQEKVTVLELVKKIEILYPKFKKHNIIIKLFSLKNITLESILEFLKLSNTHRASNQSFVIVNNKINSNDIPDEIVVVRTLKEAYDIIEMEEMERDLGL